MALLSKNEKNKRFIFLIIGIVFFVFTAICTVYSVQIYPDSLVKVDVIMPESKVIRGDITGFEVPKTAIIPDPTDINMIRYLEREKGAHKNLLLINSVYAYYEAGKAQPSLERALILSKIYGITMEELLESKH